MRRPPGIGRYILAGASTLLGGGSLALFGIFLFGVDLAPVDLGFSARNALGVDALLSVVFFLQHSGMVRSAVKARVARLIPEHAEAATYSLTAGAALLAVVLLWQPAGPGLLRLEGTARLLARGIFLLSIAGFAWGTRALSSLDSFGTRPLLRRRSGKSGRPGDDGTPAPGGPLVVHGPYRWVRHPFYTCALGMIWSCPDVTTDRLMFNTLWTSWIVVGTVLEERDLVAQFGPPYREYQRSVPMLIPWRGRR